jgi:hypothetical protein
MFTAGVTAEVAAASGMTAPEALWSFRGFHFGHLWRATAMESFEAVVPA